MKWSDARRKYPERWLLIEATSARSVKDQRIVSDLEVVSDCDESKIAMKLYLDLHKKEPQRELYVAHTSQEALNIEERRWAGVRVPAQTPE